MKEIALTVLPLAALPVVGCNNDDNADVSYIMRCCKITETPAKAERQLNPEWIIS
jgi:hypothetical protein